MSGLFGGLFGGGGKRRSSDATAGGKTGPNGAAAGKVSWDSAYRSASEPSSKEESSGSANSGMAPSQESQGQQPQELKEEMAAAQAEGERELAHLELQSGEALGTQASIPESRGMQAADFVRRKAGAQPSFDSARLSGARHSGSSAQGRRSSVDGRRSSVDGRRSSGLAQAQGRLSTESQHSEHSSGRSSFAMEQDPTTPIAVMPGESRPDAGTFGPAAAAAVQQAQQGGIGIGVGDPGPERVPLNVAELEAVCDEMGVPPNMRSRFLRLAVLQPNLPIPMPTLRHLWGLQDLQDAEASAMILEERGLMRVACLADGSAWALVQPEHLARLQMSCPLAPEVHRELLERYADGQPLSSVPDDGYILQAVGHHCVSAGEIGILEQLLQQPTWLHEKLRAYGVAALVLDFRRYLSSPGSRPAMKLLLEAFQMAMAAWTRSPEAGMMQAQVTSRLITASKRSGTLSTWLADQRAAIAAAARAAPLRPAAGVVPRNGGHSLLRAGSQQDVQQKLQGVRYLVPATASLTQAGGLQRMLLRGHTAPLTALLLSPTGTDLVTGSACGELRVWCLDIGDCVMELEGHTDSVTGAALCGSGAMLVSASLDATARVWDLHTSKCLYVLTGHSGGVTAVAIDGKGRYCLTASADTTTRLWSLSTGQCVQVLEGHTGVVHAVVMSPDGRTAVTASDDATACVWDLATGSCLWTLEGHSGWVVDVKITPDGCRAVTVSHDQTARVWSLLDGECVHVLAGHTGRINAVSVSEDSRLAATASDDGTARIWCLDDGSCAQELEGHAGFVTSCVLSADSNRAVTTSGDCTGMVWRVADGKCVEVLQGHSAPLIAACLTRKCRFAVSASADSTSRVWNLLADTSQLLTQHGSNVSSLAVRGDGRLVASIAGDEAVVWNAHSGELVARFEGAGSALRYARLLDGSSGAANGIAPPAAASCAPALLTASADRQVQRWVLPSGGAEADGGRAEDSGEAAELLPAAEGTRVKSFDTTPDGSLAVVLLWDSSVFVWSLATGQCVRVLQQRFRAGAIAANCHTGGVNGVCFAGAGHVVSWAKDGSARYWSLADGTNVHLTGHVDSVTVAAVDEEGGRCVTGADDKTCRVYDLASGTAVHVLRLPAPPSSVVLRGNACLVAASDRAYVFDLETGRRVSRLTGHTAEVTGAALTQDGLLAATCSADNSLRIWDTSTGNLLALFVADTGLSCCTVCEAGEHTTVAVGGTNGTVHFLPL